ATEVFYTDIPDLWRLIDRDGDGRAEQRQVLSTGWGVRIAFLGHDMHGLRLGPDGRLYWSIGDRGFDVTTREGQRLHHPDTGAVLRCELDGSRLAVVHIGLRNPQELAFDDRGDLFTGDNNCDAGDLARLLPIVEGGDSGWRQPGQWLADRGPWGREKLWSPRFDGQAAWIIPPIAALASGPSGLAHEPGTAFPAFRGDFLLCDFTGGADSSHVWAFPIEPDGAFYRLGEVRDLLSGVLCTDADFGPDGALYVSDWVEGWNGTGKGRIWRVTADAPHDAVRDDAVRDDAVRDDTMREDTAHEAADALRRQTAALLAAGPRGLEVAALEALLGHSDQRVRQAAELELVARGVPGRDALERAVRRGTGLARLHGVWGLGIAARGNISGFERLAGLDRDPDSEVRAQFFSVLEAPAASGQDRNGATLWPDWIDAALAHGLADAEPRVVARAALAVGRVARSQPTAPDALPEESLFRLRPHRELAQNLWEAARRADPADPLLRHALAMGLSAVAAPDDLAAQVPGEPRPLQLLRVLALRQQRSPKLAAFRGASDVTVAAEAARAIHDLPVPEALPALASFIVALPPAEPDAGLPGAREGGPDPHDDLDALVRRVLNANDRLGGEQNARALAAFAARSDQREEHRALALDMLADWPRTESRDRIHGFHRVVADRAPAPLADLARGLREAGLDAREAPAALTRGWIALCATAGAGGLAPDLAPPLAALLDDGSRDLDVRVDALAALAALRVPELPAIVDRALSSTDARLRAAALSALAALSPGQALPRLPALLATGEREERRAALQILGRAARPDGSAPGSATPGPTTSAAAMSGTARGTARAGTGA
ncbi:MAG TPA: PQQ-dependent sugar dehydrogenase, partial [Planctomycetota bacterium]|nr:PQQ-dependent sugar dehydrogenase [Planctomycetota bacterium]